MRYLKEHHWSTATIALKTNKDKELFECAKDVILNKLSVPLAEDINVMFKMDADTPTFLGGKEGDVKGTSVQNCLQTAMLSILRALKGAKK